MKIWMRGKTYYCRFEFGGKEVFQSLKTDSKTEAKRRAQILLENAHNEKWAHPRSQKAATVAKILAAYRTTSISVAADTRSNNVYRLLAVIAPGKTEKDVEKAELRIDTCTAQAIFSYRTAQLAPRKDKNGKLLKPRTAGSVNTDIRKARSVFSKQCLAVYKAQGLVIPDCITEFLSVRPLASENKGYQPLGEKTIADIDAAIVGIKEKDFELWKVLAIMRRTALRNGEALAARGEWLELTDDGRPTIAIRNRPYWKSKNRVEANIVIDQELYDALKGTAPDEFLIAPKSLPTPRYNLIYRRASKWIRQFIPASADRTKSLYELRKEAGSIVAKKDGLWAAKNLLRHKSQSTTEAFYASALEMPKSITV